jgi:3-oxosteroid 1-dehydrogenase
MTQAARSGVDLEFHKGGSKYDRSNGDGAFTAINPCLGPINTAPFFAVRIEPGDIATFVGIRTDGSARVLRHDGSIIQGLYAAGSDMATIAGGAYPAAGITIGPAMTFGWIAAKEMAGNTAPTLCDNPQQP